MAKKEPITLKGLSRAKQKMVIAQDVIKHILAGVYRPVKGVYVDNIRTEGDISNSAIPVKENWSKLTSCEVCGVGACLLSITKFKNKLNFDEIPSVMNEFTQTSLDLLQSVFTAEELMAIELMFEHNHAGYNIGRDKLNVTMSIDEIEVYKEWGYNFNDSQERLVAIMQNIIDHQGRIVL